MHLPEEKRRDSLAPTTASHKLLRGRRAELLRDDARGNVGGTAGLEADDDAEGFGG